MLMMRWYASRFSEKGYSYSSMDNIDHNPTATTAASSFNPVFLSSNIQSQKMKVNNAKPVKLWENKIKSVPELPDSYTNIRPGHTSQQRINFLSKVSFTQSVNEAVDVTWSAHHASKGGAQHLKLTLHHCYLFFETKPTRFQI